MKFKSLIPDVEITEQYARALQHELNQARPEYATELMAQIERDRISDAFKAESQPPRMDAPTTVAPRATRRHAGGRPQTTEMRALELAFKALAPDMREGTLEDWADRIEGNALFATPASSGSPRRQIKYADAIVNSEYRSTIRNRFKRTLKLLGKKLLRGDSFGQN